MIMYSTQQTESSPQRQESLPLLHIATGELLPWPCQAGQRPCHLTYLTSSSWNRSWLAAVSTLTSHPQS